MKLIITVQYANTNDAYLNTKPGRHKDMNSSYISGVPAKVFAYSILQTKYTLI